jgi:hypothetical protein
MFQPILLVAAIVFLASGFGHLLISKFSKIVHISDVVSRFTAGQKAFSHMFISLILFIILGISLMF